MDKFLDKECYATFKIIIYLKIILTLYYSPGSGRYHCAEALQFQDRFGKFFIFFFYAICFPLYALPTCGYFILPRLIFNRFFTKEKSFLAVFLLKTYSCKKYLLCLNCRYVVLIQNLYRK